MNGLMSKKFTIPFPSISASAKNVPTESRVMNGEISRKLTVPSWLTSPNRNDDSKTPGVGVAAIQLVEKFPGVRSFFYLVTR